MTGRAIDSHAATPLRHFIKLSLTIDEVRERIANDFPELLDGMVDGAITYKPGEGAPARLADAINSILRDYGEVEATGRTFMEGL